MDLKKVIYLSREDYLTLISAGTVTINGNTLTYDAGNLYIVPDGEYSFTGGTNEFTVTFPDGSTQTVTVGSTIERNVTKANAAVAADRLVAWNAAANAGADGVIKDAGASITTTAPSSSSNADTTVPTSKAVWSAITTRVPNGSKLTDTTYDFNTTAQTNKIQYKITGASNWTDVPINISITDNITGSGTSGYLTKFNGNNTITNGPQLSSSISSQSQTTKFLREDGTWAAPSYTSNTNTTYTLSGAASGNAWVTTLTPSSGTATTSTVPGMTGATAAAAGTAGLVPKPAAGNQNKFLHGDSSWTSNIEPTGEIITSNNIVLNANNKAIIQSPIPKYLWHDLFAFCRTATPTYYTSTNNTTWTEATLVKDLFAQKENQSKAVLTSTITGARWQWYSTGFSYSNGIWLVIGFAWSSSPPTYTVTFESSEDGTTWVQRHQSSGNTVSAPRWFYLNGGYSNHAYLRLTITKPTDNTSSINLSAIKLLSYRWGDQGKGSELEYPYDWDANANILPISNNSKNLGSSSLKWANVYATTFTGALSGNASSASSAPWSGITNTPTTISGYGITDAKIENGTITLGSNSITPLTSFTETDPTVPSWAKAANKPSYSLSEITNASDIQAIEALSGTSGLLKKTAANTWSLDTSNYITGITSSMVTGALGYTPYNSTNPNGYTTNTGTVTSITLKAGAGITLDTNNTAITTSGSRTISISGMDTTNGSTSKVLSKKGDWVDLPTASSLGLSNAMHFIGTSTSAITDGGNQNPTVSGLSNYTKTAGDVVLYGSQEFVYTAASKWELLGDEGSYKVKQTAVADPTASGSATAFIDTITQNANGDIAVTKKEMYAAIFKDWTVS